MEFMKTNVLAVAVCLASIMAAATPVPPAESDVLFSRDVSQDIAARALYEDFYLDARYDDSLEHLNARDINEAYHELAARDDGGRRAESKYNWEIAQQAGRNAQEQRQRHEAEEARRRQEREAARRNRDVQYIPAGSGNGGAQGGRRRST
ncbi:hypothetical protein H0H93_012753 [Arthromyces matolae]|nr:hypothetical protein H0H93_012753 [Arthromyces matolae]